MRNEHTSLEKYTSHTLFSIGLRKGWYWLCVRGELETEQTAKYWPQVPLTIAAFLPLLLGCSTGVLSAQALCQELVLTPRATTTGTELQLELQLIQTVCGTWLYNCLTPTYFLWASARNSTISTGQGDTQISSTGCISYLHRCIC